MKAERPADQKKKVFWSDAERDVIVTRAADLKGANPMLNGLGLLRAAVEALPVDRRRSLIALSQAPWFCGMLASEAKRRATVTLPETLNLLKGHAEWKSGQFQRLEQLVEVAKHQAERLNSLLLGQAAGQEVTGQARDRIEALLVKEVSMLGAQAVRIEGHISISREMAESLAVTQAKMVELLGGILTEVSNLKEATQ